MPPGQGRYHALHGVLPRIYACAAAVDAHHGPPVLHEPAGASGCAPSPCARDGWACALTVAGAWRQPCYYPLLCLVTPVLAQLSRTAHVPAPRAGACEHTWMLKSSPSCSPCLAFDPRLHRTACVVQLDAPCADLTLCFVVPRRPWCEGQCERSEPYRPRNGAASTACGWDQTAASGYGHLSTQCIMLARSSMHGVGAVSWQPPRAAHHTSVAGHVATCTHTAAVLCHHYADLLLHQHIFIFPLADPAPSCHAAHESHGRHLGPWPACWVERAAIVSVQRIS